ncbi:D-aminopeptidase [Geomicrobium halophilum]|uniref:D-aminopeptidase n=1 Tax=Geomicrobium halophilum TaxID=549000 RepID=A0A841PZF1_9BACL|nr:P1 family peptidase [Geomicrobium halophilum]MBB6450313.1 D-aminopeptidase [Geomicrobium halophilum]
MGPRNALTDVPGVKVGHKTLNFDTSEGAVVRTGVTAILPHGGNQFQEKVLGAAHIINGFGKTTGVVQLHELGVIESPIMLTNTFSVPAVTEGTLRHLFSQNEDIGTETGTANIIVGECNDGYLNDIRGMHVRSTDALEAIQAATEDVEEGNVGAGTGMSCLGFKGGIGMSSRVAGEYTVGVLVLSNFGQKRDLSYRGKRIFEEMLFEEDMPEGSTMMIVGTNAPMSERQLKRVAKRTTFGLARTGSSAAHGSGDIAIAFSTSHRIPHYSEQSLQRFDFIKEESITQLFEATVESTEEAIWNSLLAATDMSGRQGHERKAINVKDLHNL